MMSTKFTLLLLFSLCTSVISTSYESPDYFAALDNRQDDLPHLGNTNDPRTNGISYEMRKASIAQYLKTASPGRTLEDLAKPGPQQIKLNCWDLSSCSETDAFLRALNHIELSGESIWEIDVGGIPSCQSNITLLADFVGDLPIIAKLRWDTGRPIPPVLVESLKTRHPECRLYYNLPFSHYGEYGIKNDGKRNATEVNQYLMEFQKNKTLARQSVLSSTNLSSLTVHIENICTDEPENMDLIHRILLTCPNIRELDLQDLRSGCHQRATSAFNFEKHTTTLPPLEILKIGGYRFDYPAIGSWGWPRRDHKEILLWPWNKLPTFMINDASLPFIRNAGGIRYEDIPSPMLANLERSNLDAWLDYMDWSNLHTLEIGNLDEQTLQKLRDKLPKLKTFGIRGGCQACSASADSVLDFLAHISPLDSLSLQDSRAISLDSVLGVTAERHATLKVFNFSYYRVPSSNKAYYTGYSDCDDKGDENNTFLNGAQLTRLFSTCLNLQKLDIEIQTSAEWNYEVFDTLSSFPMLNSLTMRFASRESRNLYAEMGYSQRQHCDEKLGLVMTGLKAYLRKRKVGAPYEQLRTFVGGDEFGEIGGEDNSS